MTGNRCMLPISISLLLFLVACSPATSEKISKDGSANVRTKLQGSGASFPAPLYLRWFRDFQKTSPNVLVDYQAKGSGAGIQDLINETVDFAASDAAMTAQEIAQVKPGVLLLPLTAGKVVLAYNLPGGPAELRLSREAYCGILMGEITHWNDPRIAACNSDASLPDSPITVVVRSDSSGTTHVLSTHLSEINATWKSQFGTNKSINWPAVSNLVKAPKNDGVLALIKQTPGAIGYVEYSFAVQTRQPMATLENREGKFVSPTAQTGQAALASTQEIPDDLILWIADPTGDESYPIVTYTWLLCYRKYDDLNKSQAIKDLVGYCITQGQAASEPIGYIPLPKPMVERVQSAVAQIQ